MLAAFPEDLKHPVPNNLAFLGKMVESPDCSIIKLPNISAPLNQLLECITELRAKGYNVPLYPTEPQDDEERDIQKRYAKIMGSAVNPVLREGNSDRRVAAAVKAYAQKNPHRYVSTFLYFTILYPYCTRILFVNYCGMTVRNGERIGYPGKNGFH